MNKIIFLILCWSLTTACAETPSWYIENVEEINEKCAEQTQLSYSMRQDIRDLPTDSQKGHAFVLCKAKGLNVYNEDTGLNVDRLTYSYYGPKSKLNGRKLLVQDCVDKNKEAASDGEMIFKVITCIIDKEEEKWKMMMRLNN